MQLEGKPMTVSGDVLATATNIVSGDRAASHGDKFENHRQVAAVWNGILEAAGKQCRRPLDAHDVANLMEGLKIARRYSGSFNLDDYIDGAGYAAVAGECKARQIAIDESWAKAAA